MRKPRLLILGLSLVVGSASRTALGAQDATRVRIVGIFDDRTGDPVAGVDVTDLRSGLTAQTTRTGTMALILGDTSGTVLRIRKVEIERLSLVSDAAALSGREFCTTNLYLNGVRVNDISGSVISGMGRGRVPRYLTKNPVDQLVTPDEVLAIEFYHTGDAPPECNQTRPPNTPDCGITLIWTK